MNPGLEVALGIVGGLVGILTVYFLARQNAREQTELLQKRVDEAVRSATESLRAQLTTANQVILRRDRTIEARERRIEELEDELRRRT